MFLVEGADVAESVVVVAVHGWVPGRWHVACSLNIAIPLTDTVVACRIVISAAGLAFHVGPDQLAILRSVLRELRVEVLAVVRLVELRCHRGCVVSCHDGLLILPVSAVVLMRVAVRGGWGICGLILFQFKFSGRGLPIPDIRSKPLDARKCILDS